MSKKNILSTEPYKGVRDFYPEDQAFLNYLFATYRVIVQRFGYVEYHASILESAELYRNKTSTEIVNEQTYTFIDRGNREVTLRPEMTPTVARMVAARRRELGFPLRWFSIPNVFRYERPQRGRLREHWQLNVDIFGATSMHADTEIITVASEIMKAFGAQESNFQIRINSRASFNALAEQYMLSDKDKKILLGLLDHKAKLSAGDFNVRITALGIPLDALSPDKVPTDVSTILELLKTAGVENAIFDPSVVRGFDYYTGIVFEVFDTHRDNNRSLFGGGRYDNLLELFGEEKAEGVSIGAVGFGMGDVTIYDFLEVRGLLPKYRSSTKVFIAPISINFIDYAIKLAQELRMDGVTVEVGFGDKKLDDQTRIAIKHNVPFRIVIGENECASGIYMVRNLETGDEEKTSRKDLVQVLRKT